MKGDHISSSSSSFLVMRIFPAEWREEGRSHNTGSGEGGENFSLFFPSLLVVQLHEGQQISAAPATIVL